MHKSCELILHVKFGKLNAVDGNAQMTILFVPVLLQLSDCWIICLLWLVEELFQKI